MFHANAQSQNLSKGYEALKILDYFKAKQIFEKHTKKHPAGSSYGLSIIYSSNNNPFYNLDSALTYIKKSDSTFITLNQNKEKK